MAEKRRPDRRAAGEREREQEQAGQPPGLDHGAASLVAADSPDDPQPDRDGATRTGKPRRGE